MLQKTRGIVLRFTRFKETSIIVNIFTETFGVHGYIVNNIRSSKSTTKIALYQPLTLLDLVVYHRPNQQIARIKELKCIYPYQTFSSDIKKSSIALFLNEVLNKSLKEESHPGVLFEFLQNSLITLDHLTEGIENFHLIFLLKLSRLLGFGANRSDEVLIDSMAYKLNNVALTSLLSAEYTTRLNLNYQDRRQTLDALIQFYASHIDSFGQLRSLDIVRELMA
jgi:DNA repair protein RecO (recombination protein O)